MLEEFAHGHGSNSLIRSESSIERSQEWMAVVRIMFPGIFAIERDGE